MVGTDCANTEIPPPNPTPEKDAFCTAWLLVIVLLLITSELPPVSIWMPPPYAAEFSVIVLLSTKLTFPVSRDIPPPAKGAVLPEIVLPTINGEEYPAVRIPPPDA